MFRNILRVKPNVSIVIVSPSGRFFTPGTRYSAEKFPFLILIVNRNHKHPGKIDLRMFKSLNDNI
jgi:hypothetical protein